MEGGTFPYPNSGGYVMNVDDGIYQVEVKAAGCYAYSKYASYVSYGEFGKKCWLRDGGGREITHTDELTGEILRDFLLRYGQMGEHLRLDGVHSVTFLAGDEEGFYFTEYSSDNDPFIRLRYVTYEDFAASAQKENTAIWFLDSNPMENDENSGNSLPQPEEAQDIQVLVHLNPSYSRQVELTVKSGEAVGALPVPEGVEGRVPYRGRVCRMVHSCDFRRAGHRGHGVSGNLFCGSLSPVSASRSRGTIHRHIAKPAGWKQSWYLPGSEWRCVESAGACDAGVCLCRVV